MLVHLSKSITIIDIFLYWKIDLLYIFNIIKDITHNFIKKTCVKKQCKVSKSRYLVIKLIGLRTLCLRI